MFSVFTRSLNQEDTERFKSVLTDPLPNAAIAGYTFRGASFAEFVFETSDEERFTVSVLPVELSQVVTDEATKVDAFAIVQTQSNDKAWHIPKDVVEELDFFPTLRQAFYEGESYDKREADYKYHFESETEIAVPASNPVERLDENITFVAVEYLGGHFPRKFLLESDAGKYYYLRERSGQIRVKEDAGHGKEIFNAYIGREHPGMHLTDDELLNIITAVDYISIADDYSTTVSEEGHNQYQKTRLDCFNNQSTDVETEAEEMLDELEFEDINTNTGDVVEDVIDEVSSSDINVSISEMNSEEQS